MISAERLLSDRKGAEVEGLGLGVGLQVSIKLREVVETSGSIGVFGA